MEGEGWKIIQQAEQSLARELQRQDLELYLYRHHPHWSAQLDTLWRMCRRRHGKRAALAMQG